MTRKRNKNLPESAGITFDQDKLGQWRSILYYNFTVAGWALDDWSDWLRENAPVKESEKVLWN